MIVLKHLRRRAELLDQTRAFFKHRGFLEVETPLAAREAIPERHIRLHRLADEERWLQASPEMHHKRLLCEGIGSIFELAKSFRGNELGKHHTPEFTLLEWYRLGDDLEGAMSLTSEYVSELLGAAPASRVSYGEAFRRAVGVDPHAATTEELRQKVQESLPVVEDEARETLDPESWERDECLNYLLSFSVEPTLGREAPELLFHYPASQSALARTVVDGRGVEVAERFELYWQGVELANGYHELTDPVELRRRLELANAQRIAGGWDEVPMPEKLLAAMADPGLPPSAGVALGFDRLVMLATGAKNLGEVTAFSEFY
ncbi:Elongation factor P--(R)-beta-lysine ligase [Planctomycetes bacterium MalM25]|nr:Elongation factor P--(R)-beta-lysine ligase [Planctomycetes bacterium MalM25]